MTGAGALGYHHRRFGEEWSWAKASAHPGESMGRRLLVRQGDAVAYGGRAQSQATCGIDITRCRYADFYEDLREPELGFLLVCSMEGPDAELTRIQTIMQGASHCNFRYKRQQA
jgi:hypothetical protein